ncbi:MAG: phosphoribosylanthranilate isomerase [Thermoflexales bacterium]
MIVKVCGITNLEDALAAAECGADLLGFIFYPPSPRYVDPERAAAIAQVVKSRIPHVRCVGVFVQPDPALVRQVLTEAAMDAAQLHGCAPAMLSSFAGRAYLAVKSWEWGNALLPVDADLPELLLDAPHPQLWGGTGQRADTRLAASLARRFRLMLAGGLNAQNVAEAIRLTRPWGVDAASGVEVAPGRKDARQVAHFVRAAKAAFAALRDL